MTVEIRETISEIIEDLCPDVDSQSCMTLVSDRYFDSLTLVALIAELEDAFAIEVPPVAIVVRNFDSVEAISELVQKLMEE